MNRRTKTALVLAGLGALATPALAADPFGWLPESASQEADEIDSLINMVTVVTGITLIGVQAIMLWFMIKYRAKPGVKAKHTHGNHTVEMIWTIAPALILVFLALYQMDLWGRIKSNTPEKNTNPVPVEIFAKQFEWNFRYPGPDGKFQTQDDIYTVKELVVPVGGTVNAELRSMDVLHSFYLPAFRFKQDAVPGNPMKIWFRPTKLSKDRQPLRTRDGGTNQVNYWEVVCAELCGLQHTTMGAKLFVVTQDEYERWLAGEKVPNAPALHQPVYYDDDGTVSDDSIWARWPAQDERNVVPGPPAWKRGGPFLADDKPSVGGDEDEDEEL